MLKFVFPNFHPPLTPPPHLRPRFLRFLRLPRIPRLLPPLVILLALFLRLPILATPPLWYDEAVSDLHSTGSFAAMLESNARDSTPPLYFLGLALWKHSFGTTDFILRTYSVVWSMLTLGLLYGFVRRTIGPIPAACALLLQALNPLDVYFASEVRMYAQTTALSIASAWLAYEYTTLYLPTAAAKNTPSSTRHLLAAAFATSAFLTLQSHYVAVALLLVQFAWITSSLLRHKRWRPFLIISGYTVASSLLFLAWYAYLRKLTGGFHRAGISWIPYAPIEAYVDYLWKELLWGRNPQAQDIGYFPGLLIVCIVAVRTLYNVRLPSLRRPLFFCIVMLLIPAIVAGVLGVAYQPIYFRERFPVFLAPWFSMILSTAVASVGPKRWRVGLMGGLCTVLLIANVWHQRVVQRTDWREFATLWQKSKPDATTFFSDHNLVPASRYIPAPLVNADKDVVSTLLQQNQATKLWSVAVRTEVRTSQETSFSQWLYSLGTCRVLRTKTHLDIVEVHVDPLPIAHDRLILLPRDHPNTIEGFSIPEYFYGYEKSPSGLIFRWSKSQAILKIIPPERATTITLNMLTPPNPASAPAQFFLCRQRPSSDRVPLFDTAPTATIKVSNPFQPIELPLAIPKGQGPLYVGWRFPAQSAPHETRSLGLALCNITIQ